MKRDRFAATPGGLLLAALLIYFLPPKLMFAYAMAIGVHEGGHLLALWLLSYPVEALFLEAGGLVICHAPFSSWVDQLVCVGMGPVSGLLFTFLCLRFDFLLSCAGFSLLLSLYNLLPTLHSDGGRMLEALLIRFGFTQRLCNGILLGCSAGIGLILLAAGLWLFRRGVTFWLLPAGLLLFVRTFFQEGIVKKQALR